MPAFMWFGGRRTEVAMTKHTGVIDAHRPDAGVGGVKPVANVYRPQSVHMVGDGFHVRNLFPSNNLAERISPFLLLDYAGPTFYDPTDRPRGVGEHPHRGFETVTVVYQGDVEHRDSAG